MTKWMMSPSLSPTRLWLVACSSRMRTQRSRGRGNGVGDDRPFGPPPPSVIQRKTTPIPVLLPLLPLHPPLRIRRPNERTLFAPVSCCLHPPAALLPASNSCCQVKALSIAACANVPRRPFFISDHPLFSTALGQHAPPRLCRSLELSSSARRSPFLPSSRSSSTSRRQSSARIWCCCVRHRRSPQVCRSLRPPGVQFAPGPIRRHNSCLSCRPCARRRLLLQRHRGPRHSLHRCLLEGQVPLRAHANVQRHAAAAGQRLRLPLHRPQRARCVAVHVAIHDDVADSTRCSAASRLGVGF